VIHVAPREEPADFDERVRRPGRAAVARGDNPLPDYWRRCLDDLYRRYDGICAYACVHIPPVTGGRSVEHFAPKSKHRDPAYEWSNYRLVCSIMNSRKRDFEDVLDPFEVLDGWFHLQLTSMKIFPNPNMAPDVKAQVEATITQLKLNNADCIQARSSYFDEYIASTDPLPFRLLRKWSPFVAMEVERQGLRRNAGEQ
jgi:uncharacterized protein (TIGR02646 family)